MVDLKKQKASLEEATRHQKAIIRHYQIVKETYELRNSELQAKIDALVERQAVLAVEFHSADRKIEGAVANLAKIAKSHKKVILNPKLERIRKLKAQIAELETQNTERSQDELDNVLEDNQG